MDLLGGTLHRSCSCCCVPPDSHQSHSFQGQGLRFFLRLGDNIKLSLCFLLFSSSVLLCCVFSEPFLSCVWCWGVNYVCKLYVKFVTAFNGEFFNLLCYIPPAFNGNTTSLRVGWLVRQVIQCWIALSVRRNHETSKLDVEFIAFLTAYCEVSFKKCIRLHLSLTSLGKPYHTKVITPCVITLQC